MRIIRQQRLPARRAFATQDPRVRSRLYVAARLFWIEIFKHCRVRPGPHFRSLQLVLPRGGHIAVHAQRDQDRIDCTPRPRVESQQREFHRQRFRVRFEKIIHASRIRRHVRALFRVQTFVVLLRKAPQPETPRIAIRFQRHAAQHLGEFACREPPNQLHLPQAILRGDEALEKQGVLYAARYNMWDAKRVAGDAGTGADRRMNFARRLWKNAIDHPVDSCQSGNQSNGYQQVNIS